VATLGLGMALHFMYHGANDIILVGELLSEWEKVHYAVAEEANQTYSNGEPSVSDLVIYTGLDDLEDKASSALEDIVDGEGL
jgi:hypothetical protein